MKKTTVKQDRFQVGHDSENGYWVYEHTGRMVLSSDDMPIIKSELEEGEAEILAAQLNREYLTYGETVARMEQAFLMGGNTGKYKSERTMYAMSILSDVQHIIAHNEYQDKTPEIARQWMNKAKYFISEVHAQLREQGQ